MSKFVALLLLFFPTCILSLFFQLIRCSRVKIGKGVKVGFSWVDSREIVLHDNSKIGNFNLIKVRRFELDGGGKIRHGNMFFGDIDVIFREGAWMHSFNKVSGSSLYKQNRFELGRRSAIIMHHLFNVTDNIIIGSDTIIAGVGSQIWTHAFILGEEKQVRVDGEVTVGDKVYIGARSVICAGVHVCNHAVIGANTTVTKDISISGLYCNQPMRFIPYEENNVIEKLGEEVAMGVYSKTFKKD